MARVSKIWPALFALCLIPGLAGATDMAPPGGRMDIANFPNPASYETGSREWLKAVEALRYRPLLSDSLTENCPHSFDVLHYNITLHLDFTNQAIDGHTTVTSTAEESLSTIDLDLTHLTVDSIIGEDDGLLSYVHADPVISIDLGTEYAAGDTFDVTVYYHGQPGNEGPSGFGGFYFSGVPVKAYQMGVGLVADPPSMGKYWFPCWDWPCDKATAEYHITLDGTKMKVVCNGLLVDTVVDSVANTVTYVWDEDHQMAPHVMTVNAGRFAELVDSTYDWIRYWVNNVDVEDALVHFANVHLMMDGFTDRYGPYPFDKFGYVVEDKGDMEHQTCVTHVRQALQPNHAYDWLLAHEMSHMWWGDCISVGDWRDTWLSEGFATYSEAVFQECAYGMSAYHAYMDQSIINPALTTGESFPIYDPDYLWGTTVYEKGATVLHMLRHVLGDSCFFASLAAYRAAYEYGNAVTPQFQEQVETVSGQDLDWFFNEWIYEPGYPRYEYSWNADSTASGYDLNLVIDQVQTLGPVFAMPLDIKIAMAEGDSLLTLWVDEGHETFDLVMAARPLAVELDPDNWVLDRSEEVPYAGVDVASGLARLSLEPNRPNPFGLRTTIRFSIPEPRWVRLDIYDARGRIVTRLVDAAYPAGEAALDWDGKDEMGRRVAPGAYFCCLDCGDSRLVRRLVIVR
jgi:aminopeptidase N